jgi:hypothetical protein
MKLQNHHIATLALILGAAVYISLAVSVFTVLSGCDIDRGITVDHTVVVEHERESMYLLQAYAEERYDINLGDLWFDADVSWVTEDCDGRPGVWWDREGYCVAGLMFSCSEIYVAIDSPIEGTVCGTALLHEFGHCLADKIWGGINTNHTSAIFDDVAVVAADVCSRGW